MKKHDLSPGSIKEYFYDQSVDIKKRTFVLFSVLVLAALFAAVPCGLIMHEPLSATILTLAGALFFAAFVYYAIKRDVIEDAKVILSIILVFIFLPVMLFSNGGAFSGAPIWLLLGTIYIALILEGKLRIVTLILNAIVLIACWIIGCIFPDIVTEYSRSGNYFDSAVALLIVGAIIYILITFQISLYRKEEANQNLKRLFEQTAAALANAIMRDDFEGWEYWKEANKKGYDTSVSFKVDGDRIITTTENLGISLRVVTTIIERSEDVYVSLTGDQCALTNIRIDTP